RNSCLILIGDILHQLAGGEGSVTYETNSSPEMEDRILEKLGTKKRNEIFSLLYMSRSDSDPMVKQQANMIWKGLVYNPLKMLRNILDTLMDVLIASLSSDNPEKQKTSSKALG